MTCGLPPYEFAEHIFDGANRHPFNSFEGSNGRFPEGHYCLCGETTWHNETVEERPMIISKPTEAYFRV